LKDLIRAAVTLNLLRTPRKTAAVSSAPRKEQRVPLPASSESPWRQPDRAPCQDRRESACHACLVARQAAPGEQAIGTCQRAAISWDSCLLTPGLADHSRAKAGRAWGQHTTAKRVSQVPESHSSPCPWPKILRRQIGSRNHQNWFADSYYSFRANST
jgi:hypothetical protein